MSKSERAGLECSAVQRGVVGEWAWHRLAASSSLESAELFGCDAVVSLSRTRPLVANHPLALAGSWAWPGPGCPPASRLLPGQSQRSEGGGARIVDKCSDNTSNTSSSLGQGVVGLGPLSPMTAGLQEYSYALSQKMITALPAKMLAHWA